MSAHTLPSRKKPKGRRHGHWPNGSQRPSPSVEVAQPRPDATPLYDYRGRVTGWAWADPDNTAPAYRCAVEDCQRYTPTKRAQRCAPCQARHDQDRQCARPGCTASMLDKPHQARYCSPQHRPSHKSNRDRP